VCVFGFVTSTKSQEKSFFKCILLPLDPAALLADMISSSYNIKVKTRCKDHLAKILRLRGNKA